MRKTLLPSLFFYLAHFILRNAAAINTSHLSIWSEILQGIKTTLELTQSFSFKHQGTIYVFTLPLISRTIQQQASKYWEGKEERNTLF